MEEQTDEELLEASLSNPNLFGMIVDRYQSQFVRAAYKIVNNEEDARDITQDALLKIYRSAPRFKKVEGARFKSWAYKILINTAITQYHKNKKRVETSISLDDEDYALDIPSLPVDVSTMTLKELPDTVSTLLSDLPPHVSSVLRQYYFEDKALKEIAEHEHASISAIKTRLMRARAYFKKALHKDQTLYLWIKNTLEI